MSVPFPIEEHVPDWCVPGARAVQEAWDALHRRRVRTRRDRGVADVLAWVGLGDTAPLSWSVGHTASDARAESWLALCAAADAPPPTIRDWERLGVAPPHRAPQSCARDCRPGVPLRGVAHLRVAARRPGGLAGVYLVAYRVGHPRPVATPARA